MYKLTSTRYSLYVLLTHAHHKTFLESVSKSTIQTSTYKCDCKLFKTSSHDSSEMAQMASHLKAQKPRLNVNSTCH